MSKTPTLLRCVEGVRRVLGLSYEDIRNSWNRKSLDTLVEEINWGIDNSWLPTQDFSILLLDLLWKKILREGKLD